MMNAGFLLYWLWQTTNWKAKTLLRRGGGKRKNTLSFKQGLLSTSIDLIQIKKSRGTASADIATFFSYAAEMFGKGSTCSGTYTVIKQFPLLTVPSHKYMKHNFSFNTNLILKNYLLFRFAESRHPGSQSRDHDHSKTLPILHVVFFTGTKAI